jgi:hypothetical protein
MHGPRGVAAGGGPQVDGSAARSLGGAPAARGGGAGQEEKQCDSPRRSGVGEVVGRGQRGGVPTAEDGSRGWGQSSVDPAD